MLTGVSHTSFFIKGGGGEQYSLLSKLQVMSYIVVFNIVQACMSGQGANHWEARLTTGLANIQSLTLEEFA